MEVPKEPEDEDSSRKDGAESIPPSWIKFKLETNEEEVAKMLANGYRWVGTGVCWMCCGRGHTVRLRFLGVG